MFLRQDTVDELFHHPLSSDATEMLTAAGLFLSFQLSSGGLAVPRPLPSTCGPLSVSPVVLSEAVVHVRSSVGIRVGTQRSVPSPSGAVPD